MKKMLLGLCFALSFANLSYSVSGYSLVKKRKSGEDQIMRCTTITCSLIVMLVMGGTLWLSQHVKASNSY